MQCCLLMEGSRCSKFPATRNTALFQVWNLLNQVMPLLQSDQARIQCAPFWNIINRLDSHAPFQVVSPGCRTLAVRRLRPNLGPGNQDQVSTGLALRRTFGAVPGCEEQ